MNAVTTTTQRPSLIAKMADKYGVDPDKLLTTLKQTVFKTEKPATNEQLMALMIVADRYNLDPFLKQIFAFEDKRGGGIVPVVSVDGWAQIVADHPQSDGFNLVDGPDDAQGLPTTCKGIMYRKDRTHPIEITEYFRECDRNTPPWKSHPHRMLRHKTFIQLARIALAFSGIYDEDEAARIAAGDAVLVNLPPQASRTEQAKVLLGKEPAAVESVDLGDAPELPISDENAAPPWPTE
jgi:phage recombination protein Bet